MTQNTTHTSYQVCTQPRKYKRL